MRFYVTRHGQTAWNVENIVCGSTDLPLNETGETQARETAALLQNVAFDRGSAPPCCGPARPRGSSARAGTFP